MAKITFVLDIPGPSAADLETYAGGSDPFVNGPSNVVGHLIRAADSGTVPGQTSGASLLTYPDAVAATGTVTFTDGAAEDAVVITVAGVALTAKDTVASAAHFAAQGTAGDAADDAAAQAASFAAAVNANPTLQPLMSASSVAGVVTLTALVPGPVGNFLTLVETTDTNTVVAVSGATLSGGTATTAPKTLALGA